MSAQTDLTIATRGTANGAPTANVTYKAVFASVPTRTPAGLVELETKWEERTATASLGYSSLVVKSQPANGSNIQRIHARMSIPTLEVSSPNTSTGYQPAPKQAYTCDGEMKLFLPARATEAEKWELHARFMSACNQAFLLAMAKSNEQVN